MDEPCIANGSHLDARNNYLKGRTNPGRPHKCRQDSDSGKKKKGLHLTVGLKDFIKVKIKIVVS
jgi:hypothetical protein